MSFQLWQRLLHILITSISTTSFCISITCISKNWRSTEATWSAKFTSHVSHDISFFVVNLLHNSLNVVNLLSPFYETKSILTSVSCVVWAYKYPNTMHTYVRLMKCEKFVWLYCREEHGIFLGSWIISGEQ